MLDDRMASGSVTVSRKRASCERTALGKPRTAEGCEDLLVIHAGRVHDQRAQLVAVEELLEDVAGDDQGLRDRDGRAGQIEPALREELVHEGQPAPLAADRARPEPWRRRPGRRTWWP